MKYEAVIFDLFGTLVDNFSLQEHRNVLVHMASILSATSDDFVRLWFDTFSERATGIFENPESNIEYICKRLGIYTEDAQVKHAAKVRFDFTARSMTPRPDAVETLTRLKSKGYKTGLITDCSAETPAIWKSTPFAPLIDVAVFSCLVGLKKPDPRIYRLATEQLGVEPQKCLYLGDGSSQELTGASQVGMHAVLLRLPDEDSTDAYRIDSEEWHGPTISSLKDILS